MRPFFIITGAEEFNRENTTATLVKDLELKRAPETTTRRSKRTDAAGAYEYCSDEEFRVLRNGCIYNAIRDAIYYGMRKGETDGRDIACVHPADVAILRAYLLGQGRPVVILDVGDAMLPDMPNVDAHFQPKNYSSVLAYVAKTYIKALQ